MTSIDKIELLIIGVCLVGILTITAVVTARDTQNNAFMYVFDEEMQVWNRATAETLKNAKCEHIREYFRK